MRRESQLSDLIGRLVASQNEIYALMEEEARATPRPGASDRDIAAAERRLQLAFPPSYREFLLVTDGIAAFCSSFDLLGTRELLSPEYETRVKRSRELAWEAGDRLAVEGCVVGFGEDTTSFVLLDRERGPAEDGELRVVVSEDGEEISSSDSFLRFLEFRAEVNEHTKANLRKLISGEEIE